VFMGLWGGYGFMLALGWFDQGAFVLSQE
jgi:hypothetical protein